MWIVVSVYRMNSHFLWSSSVLKKAQSSALLTVITLVIHTHTSPPTAACSQPLVIHLSAVFFQNFPLIVLCLLLALEVAGVGGWRIRSRSRSDGVGCSEGESCIRCLAASCYNWVLVGLQYMCGWQDPHIWWPYTDLGLYLGGTSCIRLWSISLSSFPMQTISQYTHKLIHVSVAMNCALCAAWICPHIQNHRGHREDTGLLEFWTTCGVAKQCKICHV